MGILHKILQKYKDAKKKSLNKEEFRQLLLNAVNDGKLTKEELEELDRKKIEYGLIDVDINGMRVNSYAAAFTAIKQDRQVTKEEEQELEKIQKYLGITDGEIQSNKKELARLRLLYEIQQGNIPTVAVTNLVMQKDEKAYWSEPAILAEEKIINRSYVGGSRGVSLRVMKGVSYRIGSYRGHVVNETGVVAVSNGALVITSKRFIFQGDKKSFAVNLNKILDIKVFSNGIHFSENNRLKPRLVKFVEEGNNHIIAAILTYAINHYNN